MQRVKYGGSFLALTVGIFSIKLGSFNTVNFIIMKNSVSPTTSFDNLKLKFDLKGSMVHRNTFKENKIFTKSKIECLSSSLTLKDNELRKIVQLQPDLLNLKLDDRMTIIKTLEHDSKFLMEHGMIDYSLLLIIEELSSMKKSWICKRQQEEGDNFIKTLFQDVNKEKSR